MEIELNMMQGYFVYWNSERLNISVEESLDRFKKSFNAVGGHHSGKFKEFCGTSHDLYYPFSADSKDLVYEAYQYHSYMHFLRMLSLPTPQILERDTVYNEVKGRDDVHIFDYGCGIAPYSIAYAIRLKDVGVKVKLHLIDIPTIRQQFLEYVCTNLEIEFEFYAPPKDSGAFFPEIGECDVAITVEVFEHLYNPIDYFRLMDGYIKDGGLMITNIKDHKEDFMHVTPDLSLLRKEFTDMGYVNISDNSYYLECGVGIGSKQLFRKGM